jgi:hypothetical protein
MRCDRVTFNVEVLSYMQIKLVQLHPARTEDRTESAARSILWMG